MERKILFRGQKINSKEWVYGSLIETNLFVKKMPKQHSKFWIVTNSFGNGGWFNVRSRYHVKTETVGQYTGLIDKNGVGIFEGDIIKILGDDRTFFIRWFDSMEFAFADLRSDYKQTFYDCYNILHGFPIDRQLEIVGNIYRGGET